MDIFCSTVSLNERLAEQLRPFLVKVFGVGFDNAAWANTLGGENIILKVNGQLVGHAAMVERAIEVDDRKYNVKYVEAVAIDPKYQGQQLGHALIGIVNFKIHQSQKLGFLATSSVRFYRSLKWQEWQGSSFTRDSKGLTSPSSPRGRIMYLPALQLLLDKTKEITIDSRPGDVW